MAELFIVGIILLLVGLMLFLLELSTPGFFIAVPATVALVLGAIALGAPGLFDNMLAVPILIVVSIAALFLTMKFYERLAPPDSPAYGAIEALIKSEGDVIKTIEPNAISGKVRINHREWAATADKRIPVGSRVVVVKAEGVHLEVREKTSGENGVDESSKT